MRKIIMRKPESSAMRNTEEAAGKKEVAKSVKPKSILEAFEHIVELVEDTNLGKDFFDNADAHIKYASRKLHLTPMQVVMLAMFVDRSEDRHIMISELARYIGCRTIKILRLSNEIDVLEAKHYVRASRGRDSLSYRVPSEVLKALRNNTPYVHVEEEVTDTRDFFDRFDRLMNEKGDGEQTYVSLREQTMDLLERIKSTDFARGIARCNLDSDDTLVFVYMAHLYVENNDDNITFHDIDDIFDDREIPGWCKREFRSRESALFAKQLIENVSEDGMARSDAFKLTDKAKEELLGELNLNTSSKSTKGLITVSSLVEKQLVYNPTEAHQVAELSSLLSAKRFEEVQTRLGEAGMRRGFCCLFYGSPGTGKTETVYQLACMTGRDIMRVDVDKIKSCWVGESEKNIKALFDRYRNICGNTDRAPILLFNEADAVLGVRMEGASKAVDKMENSIQNIILQEMENLDGIMIATTNLTTNLDKAFERRFLYKIKFDKPDVKSRAAIWQAMMPHLSGSDASVLASRFDLSGGEIENVVRKLTVNKILSGKPQIILQDIIEACRHERIVTNQHTRIGF